MVHISHLVILIVFHSYVISNLYDYHAIAQAQSDCKKSNCLLFQNGVCTTKQECLKSGLSFVWDDELCGVVGDNCGCCKFQIGRFPTKATTKPTNSPTKTPTNTPFRRPTLTPLPRPTSNPVKKSSIRPTRFPGVFQKTRKPTANPGSDLPTTRPTSRSPSASPSFLQTSDPTITLCLDENQRCVNLGGTCQSLPTTCPPLTVKNPSLCGGNGTCFCCIPDGAVQG